MRHLLVVLAMTVFFAVSAIAQVLQSDYWAGLTKKQGWILLEVIRVERDPRLFWLKERVLQAESVVEFEIVAGMLKLVPKRGDRIRLKNEFEVYIVDYGISDEAKIAVSPAALDRITRDDITDVRLPVGVELNVDDIQFSRRFGHLRAVWAQVSPASDSQ